MCDPGMNKAPFRTTLAWIGTTLTMASFGFGTVAFLRSMRHALPNQEIERLQQGAIQFGASLSLAGLWSLFVG